jgi:NAD(P)-dependent dehydrogenase (short-subunit alcohol dehydrogenase family)
MSKATKRLEGKVILVTGGTSGIGHAAVLAAVREGAKVAFTGRREEQGKKVETEANAIRPGSAHFIRADHSLEADSRRAVDETVAKFGRIDGAFNNAGVEGSPGITTADQTEEHYRHVFDINVWGVLTSMKHQIPAILKSLGGKPGGSIINTSSVLGHVGMPGMSVYNASKHAVEGLTKTTALELAQQGVRVNAIAPAGVHTEMAERFTGGSQEALDQFGRMHPIGRVGRAEEIASTAIFLLSDESSFITGQSLLVDGGFTAQ